MTFYSLPCDQLEMPGLGNSSPLRRDYQGYLQVYGWKGVKRWLFLVPWFSAIDDCRCSVTRSDGTNDDDVYITKGGSIKIAGKYFSSQHWDH